MLHSFDPYTLPFSFVGRGRQKVVNLTNARKQERDLMKEIDSAAPEIDESTDSDDTFMNTQPATSDSIDCSFIDTASDSKSLTSHSFAGYMIMSKGYAIMRRALKAVPRNPQRMYSRKLQYHFSQAYCPPRASTHLSSASTVSSASTGAVCCVEPSTDHDLSTKVKTHLHITEDDIPVAVLELSDHSTRCEVHLPDDNDDDFVPCKTVRCPRCCTSDHSTADDALNPNPTARDTRKTENGQIVDAATEEEFCSHKIFHFPRGSSSAPSSNTKTPSASKGEPKRVDARLTNDVEEGTCIRKASRPTQTPVGSTSTDAGASPNAAPFSLLAVVDSARLPAASIQHLGPSTESVAFHSPFVACQVEERHVALSSSLIPSLPVLPSTTLRDLSYGSNLLANNGISSLTTSIFPTPFINIPSYGAASTSYPLAFPNLFEQVLFAEQPVSTFSGPSLSATTYDGFTAGPFCSGPLTSNSLDISSNYASFVNDNAVHATDDSLPQLQWLNHFDHIDVEMADAVIRPTMSIPEHCFAKPSAELNSPRPFLDFPPLDVTTAIHYPYIYEPPAAITVSGGVPIAVSAVGPGSEEFSTIVEPCYSRPVFDFQTDIGPLAIQSGIVHSSRWPSSILEAHSAVISAPIPERPTDFFGSRFTYPCSGPPETSSAEQNVCEVTSWERQMQGTCGQANPLDSILENEEYFQHASTVDLKVNVHESLASQSTPTPNAVIHEETIVQAAGYVNDAIAPVRHQPQYIAPSAASTTGKYSDGKNTQADDDTKTESDDDAKTESDDDAKTESDGGVNEKDVNAEVLAHAILDIPLPPAIVASVQLLGQRKRRNSCCREGITRMRAKRRQMNTEGSEEDGNGGIRAHRTRFNHLSRPSPYGSVPQRRTGHAKGHERWYPSSGLHSQADIPSGKTSQTSGVESGDSSLSRSPFSLSIRSSSKLHGLESTPTKGAQHHTTGSTSSRHRLRDEDNASSKLRNKEGPLKQTRFKGRVEQTRAFVRPPPPPANSIPDKQRPLALRRATGFGSAGRQHRAYHPTNSGVQICADKLNTMRRARLVESGPASRHTPTNGGVMRRARLITSSPTSRHI